MAGEWIKMRTDLRDDPAVVLIADRLGVEEDLIVGKLHRIWSWADRHTTDGCAVGVSYKWVDRYVACLGLADAMESAGWLAMDGDNLVLPGFDRHNGSSAKKRCDAATRQRVSRDGHTSVTKTCDENVTREERRGEREENEKKSYRGDSDRKAVPSTLNGSRLEKADVSHLTEADWASIVAMAELAAKRIKPVTDDDRRAWLKYALMAYTSLSEHWLLDAAEGAKLTPAEKVKTTRQAIFVSALRSGAKAKHGMAGQEFDGTFKRAEIPKDIWQSRALR